MSTGPISVVEGLAGHVLALDEDLPSVSDPGADQRPALGLRARNAAQPAVKHLQQVASLLSGISIGISADLTCHFCCLTASSRSC